MSQTDMLASARTGMSLGRWVPVGDRGRIPVENPATREPLYEVPAGTTGDVDDASSA